MRGLWVVGLAALALGGCQSARNRETIASVEAEQAACRSQPVRTAVERARCLNAAAEKTIPLAGRNEDLLRVAMARRLVLAEQVDRRQITQAEADLQMAEGWSNAVSVGNARASTDEALENQRRAVRAMNRPVTVAPASQSQVPALNF